MFLSDRDIKEAIKSWAITISDFDEKRLQQASYDICLWNKFLVIKWNKTIYIDPVNKILPEYHEVILEDWEPFILHPWSTVLWTTKDFFGSKEYLIQLSWKSSLARIGLVVHNTAWIVNPWDFLNMTLELVNLNKVPIIIRPWMEIAQILFSKLSSNPWKFYHETWRYVEEKLTGYVDKK